MCLSVCAAALANSLGGQRSCNKLVLYSEDLLVIALQSSCEGVGGVGDDRLQGALAVLKGNGDKNKVRNRNIYFVRVDINCDQWAEDLLLEYPVHGGVGLHNGGLDKVSYTVIISSTGNNTAVGAGLGVVDVARNAVESFPVDDSGHERISLSS